MSKDDIRNLKGHTTPVLILIDKDQLITLLRGWPKNLISLSDLMRLVPEALYNVVSRCFYHNKEDE